MDVDVQRLGDFGFLVRTKEQHQFPRLLRQFRAIERGATKFRGEADLLLLWGGVFASTVIAGTPAGWPPTEAVAIEFGCGGTPRDGGSGPTGRESVGVDGPQRHRACQNEVVADLRQRGPSVDQISRIGMDTSKHIFQLHGVNAAECRFCARSFGARRW